jgi:hypothetical protein
MNGRVSDWRVRGAGGLRPLVPSRATYWIWFGLAAILVFGMFAYLLWARSRGLLGWSELWAIEINFIAGGLISSAVGATSRWRWLKKRKALNDYEQMLASLARSYGS